jgi:hydroxyacid-oxoacid transhydrogenase
MTKETAVTIDTSSVKFGRGVTREAGYELKRLGATRVMVVTDPLMAHSDAVSIVLECLDAENTEAVLYDRVRVEPTDSSFKDAIRFAIDNKCDGFAGVGGGSSMDTAKAANLYSTYPADFLDYVNAPVGKGRPVPGPLRPLVAVPTTAGTGSETTGGAIFDLVEMHAKTGINHRFLRPNVGLVDADNTRTMPRMVAACSGFDVLCHGLESYTALPFTDREAPAHPSLRPAYQGANPISDVWSTKAIEMTAQNIVEAANNPENAEAREQMLLAASFAGVGFGNAGVHLAHGMSYPVSGNIRDYRPDGYPDGEPIVPHGLSVILNAPAVFRFTAPANPERHLHAAQLMGADIDGANPEDAGDILASAIADLLKKLDMPNGLSAIGYSESDIDTLVEGALPQRRVLDLSPRPIDRDSLASLFRDSMTIW